MKEVRNGEHVIRVDGWLEGEEEAAELLRVAREASYPVVVDLERLMSSDAHGISALLELRQEVARLHRASDFIKLLLETQSPAPAASGRQLNGDRS